MLWKPKIINKLQRIFTRFHRQKVLFLAVFLFFISFAVPLVVAEVSLSTPTVQAQSDGGQLVNKASELYRNGQFEAAAIAWSQTAANFAAQGDRLNQAMALSNLSLTYQQLGQWDLAKKAITNSLGLLKTQAPSHNKQKILAQTLDIQGYLQREIGQSAEAINTWQQATKFYSQTNDSLKVAQSKINQAQAMQDLGLYPGACQTLLEVLSQIKVKSCLELNQLAPEQLTAEIRNVTNKPASMPGAVGLRSLGELIRFIGQLEQSQIILNASLNLVKNLHVPQEQAVTYLSVGNTLKALAEGEEVRRKRENYEQQALAAYSAAVKLSTSPSTQQQAQLNQLSLLLKLQRLPEAEKLWRSLHTQLDTLPPSRTAVYLQINFAQSLLKLAQAENFQLKADDQLPTVKDIDQILAKAAAQANSLGDTTGEAYALGNRGRLYELGGTSQNLPVAEKLTQQALSIAATFSVPDIAYQFFWQLGRIRHAQGNIEDAIAAYSKAYTALQSLRSDLLALNPEVQYSFRDSVEPVYRQLVQLDLERAASLNKAGKKQESQKLLSQARNVIESLQLAELNNFFREACVKANPIRIDQIDRTAAVIYPIILPERLEILLSLPNQPPSLYTSEVTQKQLEETIEKVQSSLKNPQSVVADFLPLYQQLYNWLIQPLEAELANGHIKTLTFVPDRSLRNIPMAVLHDGKQYLVQKYAIALTPGLQLLDPKRIAEIDFKALAAGISQIRTDLPAHQGFEPLPNVPFELEQIKRVGVSRDSLLNNKFTSTKLKQEIDDFRFPIVHLATHAQFSSKADDTFILSWDRRINVKQLDYLLRNNLNLRTPIELLVLSACETASGDDRAGLGLAGVAVRAGARSTVATLWSVADESTAKFMGEFYRQLAQTKVTKLNKAEVVRQAQLTLLSDRRFNHPHFWAPFVLIGNWQ